MLAPVLALCGFAEFVITDSDLVGAYPSLSEAEVSSLLRADRSYECVRYYSQSTRIECHSGFRWLLMSGAIIVCADEEDEVGKLPRFVRDRFGLFSHHSRSAGNLSKAFGQQSARVFIGKEDAGRLLKSVRTTLQGVTIRGNEVIAEPDILRRGSAKIIDLGPEAQADPFIGNAEAARLDLNLKPGTQLGVGGLPSVGQFVPALFERPQERQYASYAYEEADQSGKYRVSRPSSSFALGSYLTLAALAFAVGFYGFNSAVSERSGALSLETYLRYMLLACGGISGGALFSILAMSALG